MHTLGNLEYCSYHVNFISWEVVNVAYYVQDTKYRYSSYHKLNYC